MDTFPVLAASPSYPVTEQIESNAVKSKSVYGYVSGRKRYTAARIMFGIEYSSLSDADKGLLSDFIAIVNIALEFEWTHPITSATYIVRFVKIPKLQCFGYQLWKTSFDLLTV